MSILAREIKDHTERITDLCKYAKEASVADDLITALKTKTFKIRASLSSYAGVGIVIDGMLKISDVTPILRFLAERGYRLEGAAEKMQSYAGWTWNCGDITVRGYFSTSDESATCKLVQTGTKTVEQPIYEMKCDENGDEPEKKPITALDIKRDDFGKCLDPATQAVQDEVLDTVLPDSGATS